MHREFDEDELPGIGRRFTIDCDDGGILTIVVRNTGKRDVYVVGPGGDVPASVSIDEAGARVAAAILSGEYGSGETTGPAAAAIEDIVIDSLTLGPGSSASGRTLAGLAVGSATGIRVITIVRGKASIHDPAGNEVLQPGDRLVFAGRRKNVPAFRRLVAGA
jgi:TrkA domain protein